MSTDKVTNAGLKEDFFARLLRAKAALQFADLTEGQDEALADVLDAASEIVEAVLAQAEQPVAWMHPTAGWASANYDAVLPHCRNDGPKPIPLYAHPPAKREAGETAAPDTPSPQSHLRVTDLHVEAAKLALVKHSVLMPTDAAIRDMLAAAASLDMPRATTEGPDNE